MAPKRKRAAGDAASPDLADAKPSEVISTEDAGNDASGEPSHENKPIANGRKHTAKESKAEAPSPKRPRSSRGKAKDQTDGHGEAPTSHTAKAGLVVDSGEHTAADVEMASLPKAGTIDPVGYKTNPPPEGRTVRVYADGVFDLFHLGYVQHSFRQRRHADQNHSHMRQLEQAKTAFPDTRLIVGVTGDTETHRRKGLTVLSARERAETVRHCRWVDEVIEDCPWIVTAEFLAEHNLDYVAHDDLPYGADEGDDIYGPIKQQGKFLVTQRTEGVSTTGIITKIVKDYEQYIARQLKRGTSRQELNVSWLKKNELDLKRHVIELRNSIKTNWSTTGQELGKELRGLWANSRPASPAPSVRSKRRSQATSDEDSVKSPTASIVSRVPHLEVPTSPTGATSGESADFARGYSLGLVGGIRSWMTRNRRNVINERTGSPQSPGSSEYDDKDDEERGRKRAKTSDDTTMEVYDAA